MFNQLIKHQLTIHLMLLFKKNLRINNETDQNVLIYVRKYICIN